jgi:hypothetical protein
MGKSDARLEPLGPRRQSTVEPVAFVYGRQTKGNGASVPRGKFHTSRELVHARINENRRLVNSVEST